jgi:hypothetical protein
MKITRRMVITHIAMAKKKGFTTENIGKTSDNSTIEPKNKVYTPQNEAI